ncbi:MAG: right-handed parallel beta-helix repeat-containing protein [Actinophytocola sp.]|uniref:right-handed parallel beta-helix repeat-containing protein n=1 Tax=Actinophytocola sp. TaxID=1872138 RepID=UPI003C7255E7
MAWVGLPADRPVSQPLLTLQSALNAAAAGQIVSFDPNDYAFTRRLTVPRTVRLDSSGPSTLFAQFTAGGGLSLTANVALGFSAVGALITVSSSNAELAGITITNPNGVLRPTGIQLGTGVTGVSISGFTMDGGGQVASFGINLTTGSATINDPQVTGVAIGIGATAASTAAGISIAGGTITAAQTAGIGLGTTSRPAISGVTVSGSGAGTGIDLANSSAAQISSPVVTDFTRGIGATATSRAAGPRITDARIDRVSREGIALGSTVGASIITPVVSGSDAAQSIGINLHLSSGVTLDRITVSHYVTGVSTNIGGTGAGPRIISPLISDVSLGGITLGSTQGAVITTPTITGIGTGGTGINAMNAGRVSVSGATIAAFLYGIGAYAAMDPSSDRVNFVLTDVTVTSTVPGSAGIYLLGTVNATINDLNADIHGSGIVLHEATTTRAQHVIVTGHAGPTSTSGSAILRAYDSTGITVDDASIDAGSYGVFFSSSSGATITNARVSGVSEYAIYGRSSSGLDLSGSTITGNAAVGDLVVTTAGAGISHDINIHDNTMTNNQRGVNLYTGTTNVTFTRNTISGQRYVISAAPAHNVTIADNTVTQLGSEDEAAVMVAPLYEDGDRPGSYSSSDIKVVDNVFHGQGTWVQVGSPDPTTPDAGRRTVRDPVLVTGNTFPVASTAIRTFPNAVIGEDTIARMAGPVAVDARDYGDPNDWGSLCRATGYLDGTLVHDGRGAEVYELSDAPVLYPTNCTDLSLTETTPTPTHALHAGDAVTWTLTPHNTGLRSAPAGWSVNQLLPPGVQPISVAGPGYVIDGLTATASDALAAGADGPTITVQVRVTTQQATEITMKNVADVAPLPPAEATDLDGDGYVDVIIEDPNPLTVPTLATDTDQSATNNDAQGFWTVAASNSQPTPTPGSTTTAPPPLSTPNVDGLAGDSLADTGTPVAELSLAGLTLVIAGCTALTMAQGGRRHRP